MYERRCTCATAQVRWSDQRRHGPGMVVRSETRSMSAFTATWLEVGSLVSRCRRRAIWPLGFQSLLCSSPILLQESWDHRCGTALGFRWVPGTVRRSSPFPSAHFTVEPSPSCPSHFFRIQSYSVAHAGLKLGIFLPQPPEVGLQECPTTRPSLSSHGRLTPPSHLALGAGIRGWATQAWGSSRHI